MISKLEVESRIRRVIAPILGVDEEELEGDKEFIDYPEGDEIGEKMVVIEIEEEFEVEIPDVDPQIRTLNQAITYMYNLLNGQ